MKKSVISRLVFAGALVVNSWAMFFADGRVVSSCYPSDSFADVCGTSPPSEPVIIFAILLAISLVLWLTYLFLATKLKPKSTGRYLQYAGIVLASIGILSVLYGFLIVYFALIIS